MPNKKLFTLLFLLTFFFSCSPGDACQNIACENNGTCVGGKCQCPEGFAGEACEINEKCKNVDCQNGGKCEKGDCLCPDGWEGKSCQARATEVWTGNYAAKDSCKKSGRTFYDLSIEQSESDIFGLSLHNFHGWRDLKGAPDSIYVNARGMSATVQEQIIFGGDGDKFIASGKGDLAEMDPVKLQFEMAIQFEGIKDSCWCTFTKK